MFSKFSTHQHRFVHFGKAHRVNFDDYDFVVIHYSVRLVSGMLSDVLRNKLASWSGEKLLFAQDEYDMTETLRREIEHIGFSVFFTCVPADHIEEIYPAKRFPRLELVSTLTGFAPQETEHPNWTAIDDRPIGVGYRGRALAYWYGDLGQEKQTIAEKMRQACLDYGISFDIEWDDKKRIYGPAWPEFLANCRATLGTESGSNIFDDDGSIRQAFLEYMARCPDASYEEARAAVLGTEAEADIMNQVSPRIFEAISSGSALVLYEGRYSGILKPGRHFIALKKDGSNISDVLSNIQDSKILTEMRENAWHEVVASGRYSEEQFVLSYDNVLTSKGGCPKPETVEKDPAHATPFRSHPATVPRGLGAIWNKIPLSLRMQIKPWFIRLSK